MKNITEFTVFDKQSKIDLNTFAEQFGLKFTKGVLRIISNAIKEGRAAVNILVPDEFEETLELGFMMFELQESGYTVNLSRRPSRSFLYIRW